MICEPGKIDAYIDGELNPADHAEFESHLRSCPACSGETLTRWQLKRSIRAAAQPFQPPSEFRAHIAGQLKYLPGPWGRLRYPAVLGTLAALLLIAVTVPLLARHYARQQAISELLDLHVATLASANPVDVLSSDRHTVKPWFQGKLPFTFNLPELANSPYKLIGGRLVYFEHNPGAQLVFSLGQHRFSVFITQNEGTLPGGTSSERGFSVESWGTSGLRYVIVSDATPQDVHNLGVMLTQSQLTR